MADCTQNSKRRKKHHISQNHYENRELSIIWYKTYWEDYRKPTKTHNQFKFSILRPQIDIRSLERSHTPPWQWPFTNLKFYYWQVNVCGSKIEVMWIPDERGQRATGSFFHTWWCIVSWYSIYSMTNWYQFGYRIGALFLPHIFKSNGFSYTN